MRRRLRLSAAACAFLIRVAGINLSGSEAYDPVGKSLLPIFETGETLSCDWRFQNRELLKERTGSSWKYSFMSSDGTIVEIHFKPADRPGPCYKKTKYTSVLYKAQHPLNICEENNISDFIADIREREKHHEPGKPGFTAMLTNRYSDFIIFMGALPLIALLIFNSLFLFMDRSRLINAPNDSRPLSSPFNPVNTRYTLMMVLFVVLTILFKFRSTFVSYFSSDSLEFLQRIQFHGAYLHYVMNDKGVSAIPYRAILPLLMKHGGIYALRGIPLILLLGTAWFVYRMTLRQVRPRIAWFVPVMMLYLKVFDYPVSDLRGYSIFIFLTVLSLHLYMESTEKPRVATLFGWVVTSAIAVLSNPITAIYSAAAIFNYMFFVRKGLRRDERYLFDVHCLILSLTAIAFLPAVFHAFSWHGSAVRDSATPFLSGMTPCLLALLFPLCAFFVRYRKSGIGALMLSAIIGISAVAFLFSQNYLFKSDRYYLVVLPLVFASLGFMLEDSVRVMEAKFNCYPKRAFILAVILLTITTLYRADARRLIFESEDARLRGEIHSAINIIGKNNSDNLPVLIYPYEHFFYFVEQFHGADPLNGTSVHDNFYSFIKQKNTGGKTIHVYGNFITSEHTDFAPWRLIGSPLYIVVFDIDPGKNGKAFEKQYTWYRGAGSDRLRLLSRGSSPAVFLYSEAAVSDRR